MMRNTFSARARFAYISIISFCLLIPNVANGQNSVADTLQWQTYSSNQMQLDFSFPKSWTFIPETPGGIIGQSSMCIKTEDVTFFMNRYMDSQDSSDRSMLRTKIKEDENRAKARGGVHIARSIALGNDTCIEMIDSSSFSEEEPFKRIYVISIPKLLSISIYFYTYTPATNAKYAPIIERILASFKLHGTGTISWSAPGDCKGPVNWRTYHSREMALSFSYPSCWTFELENPVNEGKLSVGGKGSTVEIYRATDAQSFSSKYANKRAEKETIRKSRPDYAESGAKIGNAACEKVSYTTEYFDHGKKRFKYAEFCCPEKRLMLSTTVPDDSSDAATSSKLVDEVIASFRIDDGGSK